MITKVIDENIDKLIEGQVNSRGISIYLYLHILAIKSHADGIIFDFNPNKLLRLMNSKGIKNVTHAQVVSSLNELENAGLIGLLKNQKNNTTKIYRILLFDANKVKDHTVLLEDQILVSHVHLNTVLLSDYFYKLNIRAKRLFLYLYKRYNNNPTINPLKSRVFETPLNIRREETKTYFETYMHLNNEAKIIKAIKDIQPLMSHTHLTKFKRRTPTSNTFRFKIKSDFYDSFDNDLLTEQEIRLYDSETDYLISTYFKKGIGTMVNENVRDIIVKNLLFLKNKTRKNILDDINIYADEAIKYPTPYIVKTIMTYFYHEHKNTTRLILKAMSSQNTQII